MPMTSLEMQGYLQQLYAQQLYAQPLNVYGSPGWWTQTLGIMGAPGEVIAYRPSRRPARKDCEGCGAPTEAARITCRYCRRAYALEP